METFEQINEDFNEKKSKNKGLWIGLIIAAAIVVSLLLAYFLIFAKPQFIFSKAIDKIFEIKEENYNSIKMDASIKAAIDVNDANMQAQLAEVEKYTLKFGTQMDAEAKQEITEFGLEYEDKPVIGAQIYYNEGEMYAYLDEIFDKYIQIDVDKETKQQMDEIFDMVSSGKSKEVKKATKIVRDEIKAQIKEVGEFEKEKDVINIGKNKEKVTKWTLKLSQKQVCTLFSNVLANLAENEEFLEIGKNDKLEEYLKTMAKGIEKLKQDSENSIAISIYTKGVINKAVALDLEMDIEDSQKQAGTLIVSFVKEDENIYSYKISVKMGNQQLFGKADVLTGKIEIKESKDERDEKSGKTIITAEIFQIGNAKVEIDYSAEYDKEIDLVDTSNNINVKNLTQTDMTKIIQNFSTRPVIKDILEQTSKLDMNNVTNKDDIIDNNNTDQTINSNITNNKITTSANSVLYDGVSVTYSVPSNFKYESEYSDDSIKFFGLEEDDAEIDVTVDLGYDTEKDYQENEIKWNYDYYTKNSEYYKNIKMEPAKTITVGGEQFKYQVITYSTVFGEYESKYENVFLFKQITEDYLFTIEFEAADMEVTEDIMKGFLNNFTIKK